MLVVGASPWPLLVLLAHDNVAFLDKDDDSRFATFPFLDVQRPFEHWHLRVVAVLLCSAAETFRGGLCVLKLGGWNTS